jgi:hypothetical protein
MSGITRSRGVTVSDLRTLCRKLTREFLARLRKGDIGLDCYPLHLIQFNLIVGSDLASFGVESLKTARLGMAGRH